MARLTWGLNSRFFEYGVDRAVLYFRPGIAVPWDGIIRIEENTEPPSLEPVYYDGQLVNIKRTPQTFKARITSLTFPEMLDDLIVANGSPELVDSERNQPVHMSYRVKTSSGYQIHMLYNCVFVPPTVTMNSIGSDIDITPFVFDVVCLPVTYGVNIYPHSGNRYDSPNTELTPPPPGSDPSAYADYYKNRYIEDQIPGLPPFIYDPSLPNFEYPHFDDHLDLKNMFPTPHFIFDDSLLDPDKWLSLEDLLYGNVDLSPTFGTPQEVFDLMLGPNPAIPDLYYELVNLNCSNRPVTIGYHDTAVDGYTMPVPPTVYPGDMFVAAFSYRDNGLRQPLTPAGDPIDSWGHVVSFSATGPIEDLWMGSYAPEPGDSDVHYHDGRSSYQLNPAAPGLRVSYAWLPNTVRPLWTQKGVEGFLLQPYDGDGDDFLRQTMSWNFNATDAGLNGFGGTPASTYYVDIPNFMWDDTDVDDFYIIRLGHYMDNSDLKVKPVCLIDSGRSHDHQPHAAIANSSITLFDSRITVPSVMTTTSYWESMSYMIQTKCPLTLVPSSCYWATAESYDRDLTGDWTSLLTDNNNIYWRSGHYIGYVRFRLRRVAEITSGDWFENAQIIGRVSAMDSQYTYIDFRFVTEESAFVVKSLGVYPDATSISESYENFTETTGTWNQTLKDDVYALYSSVPVGEETPLLLQVGVQGDNTSGVNLSYLALQERTDII